jgi:hypothetical protein
MEAGGSGSQQMPAGWYADPQSPGRQRYWDGNQWTEHTSGVQQVPPGPGYGQQPPKKKGGGSTVLKVALGVVLGFTVLIVGCVALIGAGLNEADEEQKKKGITLSQFRSVEQGTTQEEVEAELGEPEDAQEFEQEIPELDTGNQQSSCIYYPEKGKGIGEGRSFQFCFDNGKLTSKNSY